VFPIKLETASAARSFQPTWKTGGKRLNSVSSYCREISAAENTVCHLSKPARLKMVITQDSATSRLAVLATIQDETSTRNVFKRALVSHSPDRMIAQRSY
jgi:hypothetical protein